MKDCNTVSRKPGLWDISAALAAIGLGVCLLLNAQPTNDGMWFWYAQDWRMGTKLYSDLHFNLQPLFVLLTAGTLKMFGTSWFAYKSLAVMQLVVYCSLLAGLACRSRLRGWQSGLLILASFAHTIAVPYYRFDDYHTLSNILAVGSVLMLLAIADAVPRKLFAISAGLGVLCGLSAINRINDGAALFVSSLLCVWAMMPRRKMRHCITLTAACALTMLVVLWINGDSLHAWACTSIFRAAAIKGGTGSILTLPFRLPYYILAQLFTDGSIAASFFYLVGVAAIVLPTPPQMARFSKWILWSRIVIGVVLIACLPWLWTQIFWTNTGSAIFGFNAILTYMLAGIFAYHFVRKDKNSAGENPCRVLILVPFFQLVGVALTGGIHSVPEIASAIAFTFVLLPICYWDKLQIRWRRDLLMIVAVLVTLICFMQRGLRPFWWHHYESDSVFMARAWFDHPLYGPMYIEKTQRDFAQRMCNAATMRGEENSMLSIPYPYVNYFCGIRPWKGYVQTWYDTSSKSTIDSMIRDLKAAPPTWIVYERAADSIKAHELVYSHGKPLPHRALDAFIKEQVVRGRWSIKLRTNYHAAEWFLIQTRPPGTQH